MAEWVKLSGSGAAGIPGPAGTSLMETPAPDIVSATGVATYGLLGNASAFALSGVITLPTADPQYTHLKYIDVLALPPGATSAVPFTTVAAPFTGSTVAFSSAQFPFLQDGSPHTWTLKFVPRNESGTPTVSAVSVLVSIQASAVTSVTASEVGPTFIRPEEQNRLVYTTGALIPVLNAGQVPQSVTYAISRDNGVTFYVAGFERITAAGQAITFTEPSPGVTSFWKVACCAGALGGDASVPILAANLSTALPGCVVSAPFSVAGLTLPSAAIVSALTVTAGVGGSWPYNAIRPDGSQYWSIPSVAYNDTTVDPSVFFFRITAQNLDASHNPVGPEMAFAGTQASETGVVQSFGPLMGDYGLNGDGYVRSAPVAYERLRVYACNRVDQTGASFLNPLAAKLQMGVGGGAGCVDVLVAAGGALPPGAIPATRLDPNTLGPGILQDAVTHKPKAGTSANPANMLSNAGFEDGLAGWTAFGALGWSVYGSGFTGAQSVEAPAAGGTGTFLYQDFSCRPGDAFYSEAYYTSSGAAGAFTIIYWYVDATGTLISFAQALGAPTSGVWTKLAFTIPAAPVNTSTIRILFGVNASSTGTWWMDNAWLQRQIPTGQGTTPDGNGGTQVKATGGLGFDGSGNVVPIFGATVGAPSGQIVVNPGSLGLTQFGGVYQPYGFYLGLPSPSDPTVPKLIINTVDWKLYRNIGGAWSKQADPADLIAGTITALVQLLSAKLALNLNGVTTTIDNHTFGTDQVGVEVQLNSSGDAALVVPTAMVLYNTTPTNNKPAAAMARNGIAGIFKASDGTGAGGLNGAGLRASIDGATGHVTCTGGHFDASSLQVLGNRRTGWSTWSGTASRGSFNTGAATLQNVAEALKALIDDLHNAAGHGVIGT